jgi:hypothetical protein
MAAITLGGNTCSEFRFAHGAKLLGTRRPQHPVTLDENRSLNMMAAVHVREVLIKKISSIGRIPKVVMCIDDGYFGKKRRFVPTGEPFTSNSQRIRSAVIQGKTFRNPGV